MYRLLAEIEELRRTTRLSYWSFCGAGSFFAFTGYCWLREFVPTPQDDLALFVGLQIAVLLVAISFVALWNRGNRVPPPIFFDLGRRRQDETLSTDGSRGRLYLVYSASGREPAKSRTVVRDAANSRR